MPLSRCDVSALIFLCGVRPYPMSSLQFLFAVLQAFVVGATSQAADADSFRAHSITSGFQGSMNILFIHYCVCDMQ